MIIGYNKRNPKKGIESKILPPRRGSEKEISYNKRNPKKGIESVAGAPATTPPFRSTGYNKRNPKKGIESELVMPIGCRSWKIISYNKRNPKKGIESPDDAAMAAIPVTAWLQQKKSQKGN